MKLALHISQNFFEFNKYFFELKCSKEQELFISLLKYGSENSVKCPAVDLFAQMIV